VLIPLSLGISPVELFQDTILSITEEDIFLTCASLVTEDKPTAVLSKV
jgi:hypothetical protein